MGGVIPPRGLVWARHACAVGIPPFVRHGHSCIGSCERAKLSRNGEHGRAPRTVTGSQGWPKEGKSCTEPWRSN